MKEHNTYTRLGIKALQRAKVKVVNKAKRNNLKIPIWRKGRVEYIIPHKHKTINKDIR